jgi:serine/threonine-protein kinase
MTVIAGVMIASAVATAVWKAGGADHQPRDTVTPQILAAPTAAARSYAGTAAAELPHRAVTTRSAAPAKAPEKQGSDVARLATSPRVPSRNPAPRVTKPRLPQPEAKPYGPWQCTQSIAFDFSSRTPLAPKPCQMLGSDIQYQASLTAPGGGTGSITVALQDASSGRTVAGPKTCDNLAFGGDASTQGCGPSGAAPARGHRYAVVMSFRYVREGRTIASTSKGSAFSW